jgi:hypothetical protein
MEAMLLQKRRAHKNTANIGKLFFYITMLILVGLAIAAL